MSTPLSMALNDKTFNELLIAYGKSIDNSKSFINRFPETDMVITTKLIVNVPM